MSHIEDVLNGTYKQGFWINDSNTQTQSGKPFTIDNAEIYSTHRENQFRAEQGVPLRIDYTPNYNGSAILNFKKRLSYYFDANGNSYFNQKKQVFDKVPKGVKPFKY